MTDAVSYAMNRLRRVFPIEILIKTFISTIQHRTKLPISLDHRIREEIIEKVIRVDLNLMGGTEVRVPLGPLPREIVNMHNTIYRIPKDMTNGRSITQVVHIAYGENHGINYGGTHTVRNSQLMDAAAKMMNSNRAIPVLQTSTATIIGENTILVTDHSPTIGNMVLRCKVDYDDNFTQLIARSVLHFAKLVELATKSFIYTTLVINMDRAFIESGGELGRFATLVEGFESSQDEYDEYLMTTWSKVSIFADHEARKRHIGLVSGGG